MTDTPRVPLELTVVERKQLETFLAAAISATDRALVEFEAKLVALRDLPSEWQRVVAEWTIVRGEIERSERESRAARDASLEAHKATLARRWRETRRAEEVSHFDVSRAAGAAPGSGQSESGREHARSRA